MIGREEFAAGINELPFDLAILKPIERVACDEQEIMSGGHQFLMMAKNFTKAAFGAGALHGVSDGGTGSDHTEAGGFGRRGVSFGGCLTGVPKHKGAAIMAAPVGPDVLEIQLAPEVLLGAETHGRSGIAAAQSDRALRRRSAACGLYDDGSRGLHGHPWWLCGHENRSCGRALCGAGGRWVA